MRNILTSIIILLVYTNSLNGQSKPSVVDCYSYLKEVSEKNQIHFAYPTALVQQIKINIEKNKSFENIYKELEYYLGKNGVEVEQVETGHVLLRESSTVAKTKFYEINITILDTLSKERLIYASAYLDDFTKSALSDINGRIKIKLDVTDLNKKMVFSYLGYEEKSFTVSSLLNNIPIYLRPSTQILDEVVITNLVPGITVDKELNSIVGTSQYLTKIASSSLSSNDALKSIQLLPGVSAHDENESGLKIRGSNSDETLIVLDEIPLYNTDHYYGFFGSVNIDYIHNFELHKNILPIEYQGGLAGLLKMQSFPVINASSLHFNINTFTTSLDVKQNLGKHFGIVLAGRSTYRDFNKSLRINNTASENFNKNNKLSVNSIFPEYDFFDLNGKLIFNSGKNYFADLNFFNSHDESYTNAEYSLKEFHEKKDIKKNELEEDKTTKGLSLNMLYLIGRNHSIKLSSHISNYNATEINNSSLSFVDSMVNNTIGSSFTEKLQDVGVKIFLQNETTLGLKKIGGEHVIYQNENHQIFNANTLFENDQKASLTNLFASGMLTFGAIQIEPAFRFSIYKNENNPSTRLSPQINGNIVLNEKSHFKFSSGINHQFLREINYENPFGQSINIKSLSYDLGNVPIGESFNNMIGFNHEKGNYFFDLEVWDKRMDGAISVLPTTVFDANTINYQVISGKRRSYGFDAMLGYKNRIYEGWIAYTLSKKEDQYPDLYNNNWFASSTDRRHQFKLVNNIHIGKIGISANYIYTSGRPYLSFEDVTAPRRDDIDNKKHIAHLPDYHRLDVGIDYNLKIFGKKTSLGLSLYNAFNHINYSYIQYNFKYSPTYLQGNNPPTGKSVSLGTTSGLITRTIGFNFNIWL